MSGGERGLFLDLDGTAADSLHVMRCVYDQFLAQYDRAGTNEEFARLNGPSLKKVIAALRQDHALSDSIEELTACYTALLTEQYKSVRPNQGAVPLIDSAVASGWRIAVVTSNTFDIVSAWLSAVGLSNKIETVITGEMVVHGKPNPEPYMKALRACRCNAAASIAIEDTPTGAASALSACIPTFALVRESTRAAPWPDGVRCVDTLDRVRLSIMSS